MIEPKDIKNRSKTSLPPATSVFDKRNMTEGRERYVEVREQEGEG